MSFFSFIFHLPSFIYLPLVLLFIFIFYLPSYLFYLPLTLLSLLSSTCPSLLYLALALLFFISHLPFFSLLSCPALLSCPPLLSSLFSFPSSLLSSTCAPFLFYLLLALLFSFIFHLSFSPHHPCSSHKWNVCRKNEDHQRRRGHGTRVEDPHKRSTWSKILCTE